MKAFLITLAAVLFLASSAAAQGVPVPNWMVAIEAKEDGERAVLGSGILLDATGLVATDWHLVAGIDQVRVAVPGGGVYKATHAYAVCRGKNIAILKLDDFGAQAEKAPCNTKLPAVGEQLNLLCVANVRQSICSQYSAQVTRIVPGELAVDSQGIVTHSTPGSDRDAVWLRMEAMFGPMQRGGVLTRGQPGPIEVLGMIVTAPNPKDSLTNVLPIQHVIHIAGNPLPEPVPLAQLKKLDDLPLAGVTETPFFPLSDTLWERGWPIRQRLVKLEERRELLKQGLEIARKREQDLRKEINPRNSQMQKFKGRAKTIEETLAKVKPQGTVPSYSYKATEGRQEVTRTVPGFVAWDPDVLAAARELVLEYNGLAMQYGKLDAEVQSFAVTQVVTRYEQGLCENVLNRSPQYVLQIADAAGEQPNSEHEAAIEEWTERLSDPALAPAALIARSWSYLHLGKLAEAEQDLRAVARYPQMRAVGSASFARLLQRQGKKAEAEAQYARALPLAKGDSAALIVLGLTAREGGKFAEAAALFEESAQLNGDPCEAHRLAALVYATGPDSVRNAEKALLHGRFAAQLTHWQDESCLLALAAAEAEAKQFDRATINVERAIGLSATDYLPRCETWKDFISRGQPVRER